jgi:DNA-binding transcriptional MerR regulator
VKDKAPGAFRTISEVADDLDLPQHVLRFWETRFPQIKPLKRGGGRRYYRPEDVDLLRGIRYLLYGEGYTIKGVQRILKEHGPKAVQNLWRSPDSVALEGPDESDFDDDDAGVPAVANWEEADDADVDDAPVEAPPTGEPGMAVSVPAASLRPPAGNSPVPTRTEGTRYVASENVSIVRGGLNRSTASVGVAARPAAGLVRKPATEKPGSEKAESGPAPAAGTAEPALGAEDINALRSALSDLIEARRSLEAVLTGR